MMRKAIIFGCLALLPAMTADAQPQAPTPLTATTISQFLTACKKDGFRCSDVVGSVVLNFSFGTPTQLCMPDTSGDYTQPVIDWLTAHPETSTMKPADGITLALKSRYAC